MQLSGGALPVPSSTTAVDGARVKYCVSGYAPDKIVRVGSPASGLQRRIHTGIDGTGCTSLPTQTRCGQPVHRSVVATGIGADGNPATSSATLVERANPATCSPASPGRHDSTAGGRVSLSGAGLVLLAVIGVAVLAIAAVVVVELRRRSRA